MLGVKPTCSGGAQVATPEPDHAVPAVDKNPRVSNESTAGSIRNVIQAGAIHGGLHIHAPAHHVVPRRLPPPPGALVGRTAELDVLDEVLAAPVRATPSPPDGQGVTICAIGGAAGIGKTWLALHWAHRNIHRFPDGQLFVDLHGFGSTGQPVEPLTAVGGFLDALGVDPVHSSADPNAQAALYRREVAGKRMLIVLDNAATADQVEPLLPGTATCTVLVTGRRKLDSLIDRYGARHLHLDTLSHQAATSAPPEHRIEPVPHLPSAVQHITASGQGSVAAGAMFGNVTHYHLPDTRMPSGPMDAGDGTGQHQ
jgi:hypothetical protein